MMNRESRRTITLDRTLTALADATRRAIVARLTRGESRVTDVAEPFAMSLAAVSKHIRVLEAAGVVRRRREGREHYLSLDPRPIDDAMAWMAAQRAHWVEALQRLDDLLEEEDRAANVATKENRRRGR